jgi:hypothetical protein
MDIIYFGSAGLSIAGLFINIKKSCEIQYDKEELEDNFYKMSDFDRISTNNDCIIEMTGENDKQFKEFYTLSYKMFENNVSKICKTFQLLPDLKFVKSQFDGIDDPRILTNNAMYVKSKNDKYSIVKIINPFHNLYVTTYLLKNKFYCLGKKQSDTLLNVEKIGLDVNEIIDLKYGNKQKDMAGFTIFLGTVAIVSLIMLFK